MSEKIPEVNNASPFIASFIHISSGVAMQSLGLRMHFGRLILCLSASLYAGCKSTAPVGSAEAELAGARAGARLTAAQVWQTFEKAGIPTNRIGQLVCTAWYESNWTTAAYNHNKNGSTDFGILQINSIHWKECGATKASLSDPLTNARCGARILKMQGLNAWYGYRSHRAKCNSYKLGAVLKLTQDGDDTLTDQGVASDGMNRDDSGDQDEWAIYLENGWEIPEDEMAEAMDEAVKRLSDHSYKPLPGDENLKEYAEPFEGSQDFEGSQE